MVTHIITEKRKRKVPFLLYSIHIYSLYFVSIWFRFEFCAYLKAKRQDESENKNRRENAKINTITILNLFFFPSVLFAMRWLHETATTAFYFHSFIMMIYTKVILWTILLLVFPFNVHVSSIYTHKIVQKVETVETLLYRI